MRIREITLKDFRNFSSLKLPVPAGVVAVVGDNGQGKTNLVEAIHLALRGTSFRHGKAEAFARNIDGKPSPFSQVKIQVERKSLKYETSWTYRAGHQRLEWNEKKVSGFQIAREFPVVLFSPESLMAIKEGPEQRRLLVDELLLTHSEIAVRVLRDFSKALKTRNKILKDFKKGAATDHQTLNLLESLDPIFLPLATEVTCLRIDALRSMYQDLQRAFSQVTSLNAPLDIEYLISGYRANDWDRSEIMNAMHQRALDLRRTELESGATLIGPNRHDIRFLFAGKDSRYFCSQGQQRALILSYKMAQIMYHHRTHQVFPFLLLDDVLSELDPDRRRNLVEFLKGIPSQVFLTTTDLSFSTDFGDRTLSVYKIKNGVISSAGSSESLRRDVDPSIGGP